MMPNRSARRVDPPAHRRIRPRPEHVVGACTACGVVFAGREAERVRVAEVLRVHQTICPGGSRAGEVVVPFP